MDTDLLHNPVLVELAKLLANKTMQQNLEKLSESISKLPDNEKIREMEENAKKKENEQQRKKRYARNAYLKLKQKRTLQAIFQRFQILSKSEQVSCLVQLNNLFGEN
jgi:predicted S18 family serine protease